MSRLYCWFLAFTILVVSQVLPGRATAQPALPGVLRVSESKPVTVNDVRFVVVAESDWRQGRPSGNTPIAAPLDLQFHIANLGKGAVLFPTQDTFGVKLWTADGKELKARTERKGDMASGPVLLPAGGSGSLYRRAELRWGEKTGDLELAYYDGTGAETSFGPLQAVATSWLFGTPSRPISRQNRRWTAQPPGAVRLPPGKCSSNS
jgi:hypothetical protein